MTRPATRVTRPEILEYSVCAIRSWHLLRNGRQMGVTVLIERAKDRFAPIAHEVF